VTGLSITLPFSGDYLFLSVFMFSVTSAGIITCEGRMKVGSTASTNEVIFSTDPTVIGSSSISNAELARATAGDAVTLQARKIPGSTGTADVIGFYTRLSVLGPL